MAVIVLLLTPLFSFLPIKGKSLGSIIPTAIHINKNNLESLGDNFHFKKDISQISKIIDFGEWYHIFFKFPYKNQTFVCQKNLIVEGTIEQFEDMFKDKIIKKHTS